MDSSLAALAAADPVIAAFADALRSRIGKRLKRLFLYGSRARGQGLPGSDYDYVVVVDHRSDDVQEAVIEAAAEILDRYDALVSPQAYDEGEWARECALPLGINVMREGLAL